MAALETLHFSAASVADRFAHAARVPLFAATPWCVSTAASSIAAAATPPKAGTTLAASVVAPGAAAIATTLPGRLDAHLAGGVANALVNAVAAAPQLSTIHGAGTEALVFGSLAIPEATLVVVAGVGLMVAVQKLWISRSHAADRSPGPAPLAAAAASAQAVAAATSSARLMAAVPLLGVAGWKALQTQRSRAAIASLPKDIGVLTATGVDNSASPSLRAPVGISSVSYMASAVTLGRRIGASAMFTGPRFQRRKTRMLMMVGGTSEADDDSGGEGLASQDYGKKALAIPPPSAIPAMTNESVASKQRAEETSAMRSAVKTSVDASANATPAIAGDPFSPFAALRFNQAITALANNDPHLTVLDLCQNDISDAGAKDLAEALKDNTVLQVLVLHANDT